MKLIAVGDNVTDCYMDEGVYFPGGNAVNVAVNCRKNGAERVEYIGIFGDDENAQWIRACLAEEGVGFSRSRRDSLHDRGRKLQAAIKNLHKKLRLQKKDLKNESKYDMMMQMAAPMIKSGREDLP